MSKYDVLGEYLTDQGFEYIRMSFDEIEQVLGFELPASSRYRAWWSNNDFNNVMTKVWLSVGYRTVDVDMAAGKLVFQKTGSLPPPMSVPGEGGGNSPRRHPVFGCLEGMIAISGDTDLTKPADVEWGETS